MPLMIKNFLNDFQSRLEGVRFVFSFLSKKMAWMLSLCLFLIVLQALWEGVVVSAFAVLLDSLFGGEMIQLQGMSPDSWYGRIFSAYRNLPSDQRIVAGFVIAAAALSFKSLFNLWVFTVRSRFQMLYIYDVSRLTFQRLLFNKMSYFDHNPKGVLIQMVMNETRSCYNILKTLLEEAVHLCTILIYFAIMLLMSRPLTFIMFAICIALFHLIKFLSGRIERLCGEVVVKKRKQTFIADESLGCIKQVKLLGAHAFMGSEFNKASWDSERAQTRAVILNEIQTVVTNFSGLLTFVILVGINWKWHLLSIGIFLTYLYVIKSLAQSLSAFNHEWGIFCTHTPGMERIRQAFQDCDKWRETSGLLKRKPVLLDNITFQDVVIDYGKGPVVKGFNLVVKRGQRIALVGESGSGKTSVINSLLRLYDPVQGAILIDGTPIQEFDLEFLRSRIGVVNQDTIIFNRSIEENIRMANPGASREDVVSASKRAHAHHFIEAFVHGYQSNVGDRGTKLSGGQKQRLNIAQAFIKDPEIFVFDEATSALDTKSEHAIQEVFDELGSDKTVFMVAHRLSTIRRADIICVMDKGSLVECGSWDQLVSKGGIFTEMVRIQTLSARP